MEESALQGCTFVLDCEHTLCVNACISLFQRMNKIHINHEEQFPGHAQTQHHVTCPIYVNTTAGSFICSLNMISDAGKSLDVQLEYATVCVQAVKRETLCICVGPRTCACACALYIRKRSAVATCKQFILNLVIHTINIQCQLESASRQSWDPEILVFAWQRLAQWHNLKFSSNPSQSR